MREMFLDILKHVHSVGFFDYVKFSVGDTETKFEAMDNNRTIILKGEINKVYPGLQGEFGMARFPILQGYLNSPSYKTDGSTIKVTHKKTDNGPVPEELIFEGDNGQKSAYRFMSHDLIPDQAKFVGSNWDIEIEPGRGNVLEFIQFSGIMAGYEKYFLATTQNGDLKFFMGDEDATTDRSTVTMHENVDGQLKGDLYFDTTMVATILKLGLEENLKMKITVKGAMMIIMDTPIATYKMIIPARKR